MDMPTYIFLNRLSKSQIPEEEKNIGPNDRLILVYHFAKETGQNQVRISYQAFVLFF